MMSVARDVLLQRVQQACAYYVASVASSTGSTMDGSSFSGLTGFEIGHVRIGSAGKGRIKSRGSGSSPTLTDALLRIARKRTNDLSVAFKLKCLCSLLIAMIPIEDCQKCVAH